MLKTRKQIIDHRATTSIQARILWKRDNWNDEGRRRYDQIIERERERGQGLRGDEDTIRSQREREREGSGQEGDEDTIRSQREREREREREETKNQWTTATPRVFHLSFNFTKAVTRL
jgi:hypothetical protein